MKKRTILSVLLAMALFAGACGGSDGEGSSGESSATSDLTGSVSVSGSSTVEPISARVKELFNKNVSSEVEITVNGPGTSAGFKEFCPGSTDINDASRAIKDSEAADCVDNTELRVAFDGIAVMVHPDNPVTCVSMADLYGLAGPESEGNTWADAKAKAEEVGTSQADAYPDGNVEVIAPGTESGTYGSFIEIALEGTAETRLEEGAFEPVMDENGDPALIRTDYAGQPDDNVILDGIANSPNGFGWVGFAFAAAAGDSVKVVPVLNEETGECVAPTIETIADGSYPLSRSLYIYVNNEKVQANPALKAYVDYYLGDGYNDSVANAFDEGVGYVPLPDDLKAETDAAWAAVAG